MNLVVDALAVFRLTRLVVEDKVTEKARTRVEDSARIAQLPMLEYWISCPWCVSVPVAFMVVAARRVAPRAWGLVATGLAFSAITGMLSER